MALSAPHGMMEAGRRRCRFSPFGALAGKAPSSHVIVPLRMEHQVAPRQIKMPIKVDSDTEAEEIASQRKRPESGRYLLQVDRQTKGSYKTSEAAQSAALEIKTEYPIVQVSIYDSVDNSHRVVELLRSIGDIARAEGEDLRDPETALSCLQVFALGGLKGEADAA